MRGIAIRGNSDEVGFPGDLKTAAPLALCVLLAGCGSSCGGDGPPRPPLAGEDAGDGATPTEIALPEPLPLGKETLAGFAYSRGPGRAAFGRAIEARGAGDWPAVEAACREALLADPGHLEAQWNLALALAQTGRHDQVIAPLSAAVAGDWGRWGEESLRAPELASFRDSAHGRAYAGLAATYRERYRGVIGDALLIVGRRGKPWPPGKPGDTWVNHRSEIYAHDERRGRYLRVTKTDASVAGSVRSPTGAEIAYAAFHTVWMPGPGDTRGPHIRELRIGVVDLAGARLRGPEMVFRDVAEVGLGFGEDGVLYAISRPARPERGQALVAGHRLDPAAGVIEDIDQEAARRALRGHLAVRADGVFRAGFAPGVVADWDEEGGATVFRLESSKRTITLPAEHVAAGSSMVWSPLHTRLALVTSTGEPCGAAGASHILYAVDAATGVLRPLARGAGSLAPLWRSDTQLAYVDHGGAYPAVRLLDVASVGEIAHLQAAGGVGTDHIPAPAPCPPAVDEGRGEPLPDRDYEGPPGDAGAMQAAGER